MPKYVHVGDFDDFSFWIDERLNPLQENFAQQVMICWSTFWSKALRLPMPLRVRFDLTPTNLDDCVDMYYIWPGQGREKPEDSVYHWNMIRDFHSETGKAVLDFRVSELVKQVEQEILDMSRPRKLVERPPGPTVSPY